MTKLNESPILLAYYKQNVGNIMNLSAPTMVVFIISVVIAALGALAGFGILSIIPIPAISLMSIGFIILAAGCLFKGI